jgi:predicted aspartyl protease
MPKFKLTYCVLICSALFLTSHMGYLSAAPATCKFVEIARVPLIYRGGGMSITVDGAINGQAASVLVDTGATDGLLTHTGVRRHGLRTRPSGQRINGVGGASELYVARVDQFAVGPARGSATTMLVTGIHTANMGFDAIAGASYLLQTDLEINLAEKKLIFFKSLDCAKANLAYWDNRAIAVPFLYNNGQRENPRFEILLNGVKLTAMIDTGATNSVVELRAARRAGIDLNGPQASIAPSVRGIGSREVASWYFTANTLVLGEETIHSPELMAIDTSGTLPADILLGSDFLRSHRILIAMSQRKIYFSHNGSKPLSPLRTIEQWLQREADAGNGDAQFRVAKHLILGRGVPVDQVAADEWLRKASARQQPQALLILGRRAVLEGDMIKAVSLLRRAVNADPAGNTAPLWLFAAMRDTNLKMAQQELQLNMSSDVSTWQASVASHFVDGVEKKEALKRISKSNLCFALELLELLNTNTGSVCSLDSRTREGNFIEAL